MCVRGGFQKLITLHKCFNPIQTGGGGGAFDATPI